jgi:hypothetical protein
LHAAVVLLLAAAAAPIGTLGEPAAAAQVGDPCTAPYDPALDAMSFTDGNGAPLPIDNPYFPLRPGTTFTYEGTEDDRPARDVVRVTHDTREVMGVRAVVVEDQYSLDGTVTELTYDWFAQDRQGNVWYFGEFATEYDRRGNVRTHEGSWEAGVNGAKPGIIMKARPEVGDIYRQEFAPGEAEGLAMVQRPPGRLSVPAGTYEQILKTQEYSCDEPDELEYKYYAAGVGLVLARTEDGDERLELVGVQHESAPAQ